jgi:hypothetical protein
MPSMRIMAATQLLHAAVWRRVRHCAPLFLHVVNKDDGCKHTGKPTALALQFSL